MAFSGRVGDCVYTQWHVNRVCVCLLSIVVVFLPVLVDVYGNKWGISQLDSARN